MPGPSARGFARLVGILGVGGLGGAAFAALGGGASLLADIAATLPGGGGGGGGGVGVLFADGWAAVTGRGGAGGGLTLAALSNERSLATAGAAGGAGGGAIGGAFAATAAFAAPVAGVRTESFSISVSAACDGALVPELRGGAGVVAATAPVLGCGSTLVLSIPGSRASNER